MSVIAAAVVSHTPRIGIESNAPPFQLGLIEGLRALGKVFAEMKPDVIVLQSAHWVSTFNWYATTHAMHQGRCIADEAPDLIPGVPYSRSGDPQMARTLATNMAAAGIPCATTEAEHLEWDYASYVPLHYLDPDSTIPVVLLPTVICSTLEENRLAGRVVHQTAAQLGKRVIFLSSCALSHAVTRGPELWPTPERMDMDKRFIEMATAGKVAELVAWSPEYCKAAAAEMGGRTISGLLGVLEAMTDNGAKVTGQQYGSYAQSSGSGNASIGFFPVQ